MMFVGLYLYVSKHKEALLLRIQDQFQSSFNGTLSIKDIEPSIWKQFPNISFVLKEVAIRDTQWAIHHQDLLQAKKLYVQIKFFPLLFGKLQVRKFILSDASIYLFEDKNGFSNRSIFKKNNRINQQKTNSDFKLRRIELENVDFKFVHYHNKKSFDFHIALMNVWIDPKNESYRFHTQGKFLVKDFTFNTEKGSFIKDKNVAVNLKFTYNTKQKILLFEKQNLNINKQNIGITAQFNLDSTQQIFKLNISSPKIDYREGLTWLSPNIRRPLDSFIFEKPIAISITIAGKLSKQPNPWVRLKSNISNNILITKFGQFDSVNFVAQYNNGTKIDSLFGDLNSSIKIDSLNACYKGISFRADSTYVFNLVAPEISTIIKGNFDISKLNTLIGKQSFRFGKGNADINFKYVGSISKNNDSTADIDGDINVKNAEFTYLPRQLKFNHCNLYLHLHNQDIELRESNINTEKSKIIVSASAKNFLRLYILYPEKVLFEAQVRSNKIDLNEFQNFLTKRSALSIKKTKLRKFVMPDAIDKTFDLSRTNLDIHIGQLVYKNFEANNISAQLSLLYDGITLNNVQLQHADGRINMSGRVYENDANNTLFYINANVQKVAIDKLLYGFGSFGQNSFLPENIKGLISLKSNLNGLFNSKGQFVLGSLKGTTSFELENGELIEFKPLIRMGKIIFRRKRLEKVHFAKLKNELSINGNAIKIPPMMVRSDLIHMQIGGVFNLDKGTDLDIEIPLFNNDKSDLSDNNEGKEKAGGYKVYVKGKDDELGNIHFKWSLKNKEIAAARAERKKAKQKRELSK